MAAPKAPRGAKSDKIWRNAIRKAVAERIADEDSPKKIKALHLLARKLVQTGLEGDVAALKEIGDRLDGKPVQATTLDVAVQITRIERKIVEPPARRLIEGECVVVPGKLTTTEPNSKTDT